MKLLQTALYTNGLCPGADFNDDANKLYRQPNMKNKQQNFDESRVKIL